MRSRLTAATPRLLVLLHGLCMNDLQWQRAGHDHGDALARELGFTPIYLHYNSGLSVSTNGRILAQLMERLFDAWPVPIERFALIGHSMGGLVARSALHHSALIPRGGPRWPARVDDLVCLGTPHQGAPLERAGHGVDRCSMPRRTRRRWRA
jgi:pimeloyl-ACP methyl ester carboxylesterase